jgi:hypothetical protein
LRAQRTTRHIVRVARAHLARAEDDQAHRPRSARTSCARRGRPGTSSAQRAHILRAQRTARQLKPSFLLAPSGALQTARPRISHRLAPARMPRDPEIRHRRREDPAHCGQHIGPARLGERERASRALGTARPREPSSPPRVNPCDPKQLAHASSIHSATHGVDSADIPHTAGSSSISRASTSTAPRFNEHCSASSKYRRTSRAPWTAHHVEPSYSSTRHPSLAGQLAQASRIGEHQRASGANRTTETDVSHISPAPDSSSPRTILTSALGGEPAPDSSSPRTILSLARGGERALDSSSPHTGSAHVPHARLRASRARPPDKRASRLDAHNSRAPISSRIRAFTIV